jgi:uncharacterized protein YjbI with pentapeptide repeats
MVEMITLHHSCTDLRDADVSGANLRDARLIEAKHCQVRRGPERLFPDANRAHQVHHRLVR